MGDQYFHCFGCGASGDVFELMERMDGLSFMESVSLLFKRPAYSFLLSCVVSGLCGVVFLICTLNSSAQGSSCRAVFFMLCFACLRNATVVKIHASQIT